MTTRRFITSAGTVARTGTGRAFLVCHRDDGSILYRTDVLARARTYKRRLTNPHRYDVIDVRTGAVA